MGRLSPKLENLNLRSLNIICKIANTKQFPQVSQLIPVAAQVASLLHLITETQANFASSIYIVFQVFSIN